MTQENNEKQITLQNIKDYFTERGYEDAVVFDSTLGYDYATAFVGVSEDGRAIYDYEKMVEFIVNTGDMDEEGAIEWIDYNTIRALPYAGDMAPIIMYPIDINELL
jgi:hypothetical protein